MNYIKTYWTHNNEKFPNEIISEMDENRFEVRKIEKFSNGNVFTATKYNKTGTTILGIVSIPEINEINKNNEFKCIEISKEEFYKIWKSSLVSN